MARIILLQKKVRALFSTWFVIFIFVLHINEKPRGKSETLFWVRIQNPQNSSENVIYVAGGGEPWVWRCRDAVASWRSLRASSFARVVSSFQNIQKFHHFENIRVQIMTKS